MTSRLYFKEELAKLNSDILEMGEQIESGITKTMNAVKSLDKKAAQELIDGDDSFDHQERAIEKYCIDLVIRESPISSDWRKIASVMRIVSDLERIADHFSDIAEYILRLDELGTAGMCPEYFDAMFGVVKNMLSDTIRAFVEYDTKLSATVIERDNIIDDLFEKTTDMLTEIMESDSARIKECVCYIFINKYIERMADHVTNIAEWIPYIASGIYEM